MGRDPPDPGNRREGATSSVRELHARRVAVPLLARLRDEDQDALDQAPDCLLYTSDAADDLLCVDLGGRRIIKKKNKKKKKQNTYTHNRQKQPN